MLIPLSETRLFITPSAVVMFRQMHKVSCLSGTKVVNLMEIVLCRLSIVLHYLYFGWVSLSCSGKVVFLRMLT